MNRLSRFGIKKGNISLSRKTTNWLLNNGGGTYKQVIAVMKPVSVFISFSERRPNWKYVCGINN